MQLRPLSGPSALRGRNFMTQDVVQVGTGTLRDGRTAHVEISRENPPYWSQTVERIPNGGPLWGLSFRSPNGRPLDPDPSRCFRSRAELEAYLTEL